MSTIMDHIPVNVIVDTPLWRKTALVMLITTILISTIAIILILTDVDECQRGEDNCHTFASCNDTEGSYHCFCNEGFIGDGVNCTGRTSTTHHHNILYC